MASLEAALLFGKWSLFLVFLPVGFKNAIKGLHKKIFGLTNSKMSSNRVKENF